MRQLSIKVSCSIRESIFAWDPTTGEEGWRFKEKEEEVFIVRSTGCQSDSQCFLSKVVLFVAVFAVCLLVLFLVLLLVLLFVCLLLLLLSWLLSFRLVCD